MLSKKAVKDYQEIYKRKFGKGIPEEEARVEAGRLLRLFQLIYRPIKKHEDKNNTSD